MSETRLGGPCRTCGLPQFRRSAGCTRTRVECPYGINLEPAYPKPPETAWLIEQDNHFPRHRWLRVVVESSNGVPRARIDWTEHADIALRFARKEDARAFAALHHEHCTLALLTEHYWISVPSPTEPAMPAERGKEKQG